MDKFSAEPASWADSTVNDPLTAGAEDCSDSALRRAERALAAARGEAKGLLIASEMAERAWAALWEELRTQRADRADLEHGLELLGLSLTDAKAAAAETGRRLAETEARLATAEADLRAAAQGQRDAESEMRTARAALGTTRAELQAARDDARAAAAQLAESRARLADTLGSHSWRITAPVRWLSAMIYRR